MGARSEKRAKAAIRKIEDAHPHVKEKGLVIWLPLDLTEPADVIKSAKDFLQREKRLDILVNSAARLASDYELSAHNVELSVAINYVDHFVLVENLMPVLKATTATPGSDTRIMIRIDEFIGPLLLPQNIRPQNSRPPERPYPGYTTATSFFAKVRRYNYSKLCNELFKIELQRRLNIECPYIIALSIHPGSVGTENCVTSCPPVLRPFGRVLFSSPATGATSALFAATAPDVRREVERYKGAYLDEHSSIKEASVQGRDMTLAADLWNLKQEIVDKILAGKL